MREVKCRAGTIGGTAVNDDGARRTGAGCLLAAVWHARLFEVSWNVGSSTSVKCSRSPVGVSKSTVAMYGSLGYGMTYTHGMTYINVAAPRQAVSRVCHLLVP